jgi:ATP-dependent RNA helicase DHX8/PRP22
MDMSAEEIAARNPDRPATVPLIDMPELDDAKERKAIKRISSPERWEIKQMMAANVVDVSELPDFDEETGLLPKEDENSGILRAP